MNLENLNVTELDAQEKVSVDGGIWQWVAGALAWYVYESLDDIDSTEQSLKSGAEAAMSIY